MEVGFGLKWFAVFIMKLWCHTYPVLTQGFNKSGPTLVAIGLMMEGKGWHPYDHPWHIKYINHLLYV